MSLICLLNVRLEVTKYKRIDLLVNIFKLQFKLLFLLVTFGHHLLEVVLDLDHLLVQPTKLCILLFCRLVHLSFFLDCLNLY